MSIEDDIAAIERVPTLRSLGREALRMVEESQPDVVVMDVAMPGLNGIDTTRLIHERWPTIQILILSMHANREYVLRSLRAGARGYVLKRSAGSDVLKAIRAVHQGRRYLSQKIADDVIDDYLRDSMTA